MFDYHVEVYRYLRDHGKPYTQQDAADYAKIRAPQPPSRSLVKRIKRAQLGLNPRAEAPVRAYPASPRADAINRRLEWSKMVSSQLGGSKTIAPAPTYDPGPRPIQWIDADRNAAFDPDRPVPTPAECEDKIRRDRKTTILALSRMMYSEYQPDMLEIIDLFGSIAEYEREVDA